MSAITVVLHAAMLCYQGSCYPALVGKDTPIGNYPAQLVLTTEKGYGPSDEETADMLQFKEDKRTVWAIHRIWLLKPSEHRLERIESDNPEDRISITHGCINVMPEVFDEVRDADEVDIIP